MIQCWSVNGFGHGGIPNLMQICCVLGLSPPNEFPFFFKKKEEIKKKKQNKNISLIGKSMTWLSRRACKMNIVTAIHFAGFLLDRYDHLIKMIEYSWCTTRP